MPDPLWQRLLGDPLKDITRKERRSLLGVSILGILLAKTGLIPRKIESIGVEFPADNAPALLLTLAAVVLYFLVAFVVYAASDFIAWIRSYHDHVEQMDFDEHKRAYEAEEAGAKNVVIGIAPPDPWWFLAWRALLRRSVLPTSVARAVVEFLVPLAVGFFAFVSLLRAAHAAPHRELAHTVATLERLNGVALCVGFVAALPLAFLPPQPFQRYTKKGEAFVDWTGAMSGWGRVMWWLSLSGPLLLAVAFALQFVVWWRG